MAKADWKIALLSSLGAPLTKQNLRFLSNWQRWEGGHTNNSASFNWLNTTSGESYPSINSVGVRAFPDFQTGIDYTKQTLLNGRYNNIVAGLRSGNPYKFPVSNDLSVWVSGSPTKGLKYAKKVLGSKGVLTSSQMTDLASGYNIGNSLAVSPQSNSREALLNYIVASNQAMIENEQRPSIFPFLKDMTSQPTINEASLSGPSNLRGDSGYAGMLNEPLKGDRKQKLLWAIQLGQKMGLSVRENPFAGDDVDDVHVPGSYHYSNRAIDVSGPPNLMAKYYQILKARYPNITELFYDPLGGIKHGKEIGAIGNHDDHVHAAF